MKTIAIKVEDELHSQLVAIAQLEGVTVTELVRDGVENHLAAKRSDGSLAERAKAALEEIDREAASKRDAIAAMIGTTGAKAPRGRGRKASGNEPADSDS